MADELWVVRAGEGARYADEFLAGGYIAISFTDFAPEDLSSTGPDALKARSTNASESSYANQLNTFIQRIQVGDLVIVPRRQGRHDDYLLGRVTGPYIHVPTAPQSGPHRRSVDWLGRFERTALGVAGARTMKSLLTIFRPTTAEAELRALFTALLPVEGGRSPAGGDVRAPMASATASMDPVRVEPPQRRLTTTQLDIQVDSDGRARISCRHPAVVMEQVPRHIEPGRDWVGVPGVYVLTGTDVQQTSTRAGKERTLTTTSIVRPWAYVGLSEDLIGRLTAHRQSKPEWRRALVVRAAAQSFSSDDLKYLEARVHAVLAETGEVLLTQSVPRGNISAHPHSTEMLDASAETVVAVLRLTGTLI